MVHLEPIKRSDMLLTSLMRRHYSAPKGFVGRNICYLVCANGTVYGAIVGGSATRFLPGRNAALGVDLQSLNRVINNIFFHVEPTDQGYPMRNFTSAVLKSWRSQIVRDWEAKYGDLVLGFESLVELPRTGECYRRDGWQEVGLTKGYTCKRIAGKGSDTWTGKRVWDTKNLRPKRVFVRAV